MSRSERGALCSEFKFGSFLLTFSQLCESICLPSWCQCQDAPAAILLCVAIYVSQRSTKSRLAEVEEQVQMLQLVAQRDQFRAENARLR